MRKLFACLMVLAALVAALFVFGESQQVLADDYMCHPLNSIGGQAKTVTNPVTGNSYHLNGRGCANMATADLPYFKAQGFIDYANVGPGGVSGYAATPSNVKNFGALGNSTGVAGSGHDDTSSIQSAINTSINGDVYFPCGIYRITSPITTPDGGKTHLYGDGYCSQIFNDEPTSGITISAHNTTFCDNSVIPCTVIEKLTFITPTHHGVGNIGIDAIYQQHIRLNDNTFLHYNVGITLATSYAPEIIHNYCYRTDGSCLITAEDSTGNAGQIIGNTAYSVGLIDNSYAFYFGAFNGAMNVLSNDIEGSYGGMWFNGGSGVSVIGNYIEFSSTNNLKFTGIGNLGYVIKNNLFGQSPDTTIFSLSNSVIAYNGSNNTSTSFDPSGSVNYIEYHDNQAFGTGHWNQVPPGSGVIYQNALVASQVVATVSFVSQSASRTTSDMYFYENIVPRWQIGKGSDNTFHIFDYTSQTFLMLSGPVSGVAIFPNGNQITETTVALLPTCNATTAGMHSTVTNAVSGTYLSIVVGGGAFHVPVYCNGTNWVIG